MTTDHQPLAERYLAMLNQHDPDAVEGFVAAGYINHNPFVADGREANRAFWAAFFTASTVRSSPSAQQSLAASGYPSSQKRWPPRD